MMEIIRNNCATVWVPAMVHSPKRLESVMNIMAGTKEFVTKILFAVRIKFRMTASK